MDSYGELFLQAMDGDHSSNKPENGILIGKIISVEDDGFFVTVGGKSEMHLPSSEISSSSSLKIGDEVQVVEIGHNAGIPCVSQKRMLQLLTRQDIEKSLEEGTTVQATVRSPVANREGKPSGYLVSINGVEGFLPLSQVRVFPGESVLDKVLTVVVIKSSRDRVVVSERVVQERDQEANFGKFLDAHKIGDRISVVVSNVSDSFALVSGENIIMFLHITEFDWSYVKTLSGIVKSGDKFDVIVLGFDTEKFSVKVSRKQAMENPVLAFIRSNPDGKVVSATVTHFTRSSALLRSDDFVEFVLPSSEISWSDHVSDPKTNLNVGDRLEVRVKNIDHERNKILVSLKDLLDNPWDRVQEVYPVNARKEGKIAFVADFGIFVAFPDGIQGLIRIEDVDWDSEGLDLGMRFKKNDPISVVVLQVNTDQQKLRLGIKQLSTNPIIEFANAYPVGSELKAKVSQVVKSGITVQFEGELEAFIPVSHLSEEPIADINEAFKIGAEVIVMVRKVLVQKKSIELSIKDLAKKEARKEMDRYMKSSESEIPTLGSIFGDILKK